MKPAFSKTDDWLFLEEWRRPAGRLGLKTPFGLQLILTLAAFTAAVIVAFLAHFGLADLLVLTVTATLHDPNLAFQISAKSEYVYGFYAEFNHAFYYLTVAPVFIALALQMCRQAGSSLQELVRSGLVVQARVSALRQFTHRINGRALQILVLAVLTAISLNFITECGSLWVLSEARAATDPSYFDWSEIGYVQAAYLEPSVKAFNNSIDGEAGQAGMLNEKIFADNLSSDLATQLVFGAKYAHWDLSSLVTNKILKSDGEVNPQIIGIDLVRAADPPAPLLKLTASQHGSRASYTFKRELAFWLFLVLDLVLEGAFQGFVGWVLFKIGAYIFLMYNLLPSRGSGGFTVTPLLFDTEHRFGMDPVFRVYNLMALTIAVGSSFLILKGINSLDARSSGVFFDSVQPLQIAALISIALSLVLVVGGPALLFRAQLREKRNEKLRELEGQLQEAAKSSVHNTREAIFEELRLVRSQTMWPKTDAAFLTTVGLSIICIIFPFPIVFNFAPADSQNWISLADKLADQAHQALLSLYGYN